MHDIQPVKNKKMAADDLKTYKVYTLQGWHDYIDESEYPLLCDVKDMESKDREKALAMQVDGDFFIKTNNSGHFYNPHNPLLGGTHAHKDTKTGKPVWQWRRVNKVAFQHYIYFLKTKNSLYLVNAERNI